jgi:hypothetical protein
MFKCINLSCRFPPSSFFLPIAVIKRCSYAQKEAVSTSHCSQPNTLEYDMAMEWCLLQDRSDLALRKLRQVSIINLTMSWDLVIS